MSKKESVSDVRRVSSEGKKNGSVKPRKDSGESPSVAPSIVEHPSDTVEKPVKSNVSSPSLLSDYQKGISATSGGSAARAISTGSSSPPPRPARVPSKPEPATPGWAHPSQKLPNPYLDMPVKREKKELMEAPSSRFDRTLPTPDKQPTVKQIDTSSTSLTKRTELSEKPLEVTVEREPSKGKLPIEKESSKPKIVVDKEPSKTTVTMGKEPSKAKPTIEKEPPNAKMTIEKEPPKAKITADKENSKPKIVNNTELSKKALSSEVSTEKFEQDESKSTVSVDRKKDRRVSIAGQAGPGVTEPKKKYFLTDKKHTRHSRKNSRKSDKTADRSEGGGNDGDLTVAHPDFLDESYLEAVDNEPRRESRISDDYYGGGMKPLRMAAAHKKRNTNAFKERVHKKRKGGRVGGLSGVYDWEVNKRLPDDVVPFQYTVYLEPHIESNIFFGRVNIALDVVLPKSQIWLHARNLHITSTQLFDQNENQIPILGAHKFRKHEFFVIFMEANLRPGIYMINIDYNGILSERNQVGIFIRNYKTRDGSRRHIVYTQLAPLYARRVFPCFDEPIFKATYEISVVRPTNDFIAISNMFAENEEEDAPQRGTTTVYYYITAPISPYHLSVIICDFHHIAINDDRINVPFTIYIRDEKVENYKMAINIVLDAVEWFQEYCKVKFPLPKLDLVIMPELSLPCIEGYSVIIIQEDLLKAKEEYEFETLHYTLTREVISQWIGGSVTVAWWNDLWCKEGLTTMLTNLYLDTKYPEQQAIPNFVCYSLQPSMFYDTFVTTKKIDRIVEPNDIADCMDPVAFTKAAAIFRMLEQMEPTSFMEGLQEFISVYHLQNATWKNLSECLTGSYNKNPHNLLNVDNVLFSWSQYPGYPLVASAIGLRAIAMNQRRFLTTMDSKTLDINSFPSWEFPVSYVLSNDPLRVHGMSMKSDCIDGDARSYIPEGTQWYKVNNRQTGFFRVVYQDEEWNTIKKVFLTRPELFTPEDRANFLDDMFSLSRAGFTCYGHTLSTLTYLRYGKETNWLPWACILKHLVYLKNVLSSDAEDAKNFERFMAYIINPILTEDVWTLVDKEDPLRRKWKMAVLRVACTMEIPAAKSRLAHLIKVWGFNGTKPKPEALRFLILRYGAPENGYTDHQWLSLWKMYQDEKKILEKQKLLAIMASVGNDSQLRSVLHKIKTDDVTIDDHGFFTVLYEMATTRKGCLRVWDFVRTNWTHLIERFSPTDSRLFLLFPHVAQLFDQDSQAEELMEFISYEIPTLSTAISYANNNIYWNNRYRRTVSSWLRNVQKTLAKAGQTKSSAKHKSNYYSPATIAQK